MFFLWNPTILRRERKLRDSRLNYAFAIKKFYNFISKKNYFANFF